MYKGEIVAVIQLFVIITIDVGYTSFHFVLVSDLTLQKFKFIYSLSPERLIIPNIILTYKITEVMLEGNFVFVFCKRESKYAHLLKCNLNTCMKVLEEPVTNLEYRRELRFTLLFPHPVTTPWSWRSFPNGIEQLILI